MDALSNPRPNRSGGDAAASWRRRAAPDALSCVPPEAPLAMPTQSLTRFDRAGCHEKPHPHPFGCWLARLFVFGGGFCLTVYGAYEMYKVIEVGGVTLL